MANPIETINSSSITGLHKGLPSSFSEGHLSELLESCVKKTWPVLVGAYGSRLTSFELDYLLSRYVLGLTIPYYSQQEPTVHLDACRCLLACIWPLERVEKALRVVPVGSDEWVSKAFGKAEELGSRNSMAILQSFKHSDLQQKAVA